jgi:hypothetical protein
MRDLPLNKQQLKNGCMFLTVLGVLLLGVLIMLYYTVNEKDSTQIAKDYTTRAKQQLKDSTADIVFYVDLSLDKNDYRFFVLNTKDSVILEQGLCLSGKLDYKGNVIFSNKIGSNCSSKGVYEIGNEYTGQFGKAFKLNGLDSTNSNALARCVVLHSYGGIPETPNILNVLGISEGCPTVNPSYLEKLSYYIKNEKVKYLIIN